MVGAGRLYQSALRNRRPAWLQKMTGEFVEVIPPERLSFTSAALEPSGQEVFRVLTTVTLIEEDGQTTLDLEARVISETDGAEVYISGMQGGWTQSLERLAAHLAQR
jgi:uncharacterized protein YndB with AHSA1/START domain